MKCQLHNNRLIIAILFIANSNICYSQGLINWVGDQIRDYVDNKINEITNYNQSTLGSLGSMLWDGVVSAKTESDLKEKMQGFKDYKPSNKGMSSVYKRYSYSGDQSNYCDIYLKQSNLAESILYSNHNLIFSSLGNGSVGASSISIQDSIAQSCKIVALENVLNRTVMDSLKEMAVSFKNFNETLLSDINENPDIAIVLNNHPEILRIYLNSFNAPSLRKKPSHLFYWGHTADSHKELLGKKKKHIINAKSIIFQENGNQVDMYLSGKIIAKYANDIITCNSIELLNLIGKPSTTYKYQDFTCSTDHMGRTKEIKQTLKNKGKCSDKSKIKPKEYVFLHGNTETNKLIQLGVVNYGAPMTLLNSFFIKDSPKSARVIKEIKKSEKSYLKSEVSGTVSYSLIYDNGQRIPLQIKISYGNAQPIIIINDRAESGI